MRALRVHDFGEPDEVLVLDEVEPPTPAMLRALRMSMAGWVTPDTAGAAPAPSDDWVIVQVSMAALALPDVTMARGTYPVPVPRPYTSGQEGVGVVLEAGPPHQHLVGKRIASCMIQPFGSLAEVAVGVGMIVEIAPDMSDADAAALMIPAHTGYHTVVRRGAVTAGETVAVRGAAGGLGAACVQLAHAVGARSSRSSAAPTRSTRPRSAAHSVLTTSSITLRATSPRSSGGSPTGRAST